MLTSHHYPLLTSSEYVSVVTATLCLPCRDNPQLQADLPSSANVPMVKSNILVFDLSASSLGYVMVIFHGAIQFLTLCQIRAQDHPESSQRFQCLTLGERSSACLHVAH